jgi:putative redox protein
MHVIYEFKGKDLPLDKLERAVELSREKYCGVSAMYKKAFDMTYEIRVIS